MPIGGPIVPGQEQVDEALRSRQRQQFFEQQKIQARIKLTPNEVSDDFKYIKEQMLNWKDERLDFNNNMERAIPFSTNLGEQNAADFTEVIIERGSLGTDKLGAISTDKILDAITDAVQITGTLAGSTTLNNGQQAVITVTLDDTANPNRVMLGVCHMTPYHTSVSGSNVIPYGASTTEGQWHYLNRADWNSNNNKKSTWVDFVSNVSAGTKDVMWRVHYRYIGRVAKEGGS